METHKTLYPIKSNGKYGYINNLGEICIEPEFDYAEEFNESLAIIGIDDSFGFIDMEGNLVVKAEYEDVYEFSEGLAMVELGLRR